MRLLLDGHSTGAENMARDEALLEAAAPVVRLYGWRPATASLGRAQGPDAVDAEAARALGVDVVRRATGGGAILHNEEEVTYAVVLPHAWPGLPRDIPGSFAYLAQGVVLALRALGVPAEIEDSGTDAKDALCYLRRQGTNVVVLGPEGPRKISGGAQRRTAHAVLQHGTVILRRDEERMARLFRADVDAVRRRVTSLEVEGVRATREAVVRALVEGYARAFGVAFTAEAPAAPPSARAP